MVSSEKIKTDPLPGFPIYFFTVGRKILEQNGKYLDLFVRNLLKYLEKIMLNMFIQGFIGGLTTIYRMDILLSDHRH